MIAIKPMKTLALICRFVQVYLKLEAAPKRAIIHIQNTALDPPKAIAIATQRYY